MLDVDERLAVLERDWILVILILVGMVRRLICRRHPFPARIVALLRFQSPLLRVLFIILAE
jgi:hypothetical protein